MKKIKRVCFLSYSHPYDDSRVFHKEAYSLAQAGYQVIHLAPGGGDRWHEKGIDVVTFTRNGGGAFGRLSGICSFFTIARRLQADCYHCNEMESWLIGCLLKIASRKKVVIFDVHEHYPSRASEPHFPRWFRVVGGPLVRAMFFLLTPITDYFIFAKQSVAADFNADGRFEFVFNYAPLRMKLPVDGDIDQTRLRDVGGPITAIHIGVMSRARGWPQLLQALARMKRRDFQVILLGNIHEGAQLVMEEAAALGVENRLQIVPGVTYEKVFEYLKSAQIGLMLYQPGFLNHVYAFPIKMYDYMLAGLPFVGPDFAVEVEPVVSEIKCGLLVDTSNPNQIAEALDWYCENKTEAQNMGIRGMQAVLEKFNWEKEKDKLLRVYEELL